MCLAHYKVYCYYYVSNNICDILIILLYLKMKKTSQDLRADDVDLYTK